MFRDLVEVKPVQFSMSIEVLPATFATAGNRASSRKMGCRFTVRWAVFSVFIGLGLLYFFHFPVKLQSLFRTLELEPLILDVSEQIVRRKAAFLQDANVPFETSSLPTKTVLFWTSFFGHNDPRADMGARMFEGCPINKCVTTGDRTVLSATDAVIFHGPDINSNFLPAKRSSNQHYVFFIGESPISVDGRIGDTPPGFFDMTYTYKLDSDVLGHYIYSVPLEQSPKNFAEGKSKMVAWFVSNCKTHSRRENYVKELQKYIDVDIYGKCGPLKCPRGDEAACNDKLRRDYKFYLSFENSICQDYATEKFTNALHNYVVPIVLGGGNMTIFPPKSYIRVDDFPSAKELAEHLHSLDQNDAAYNEYMNWRFNATLIASHGRYSASRSGWCQLCERLHDPNYKSKEYLDAKKWFYESGRCTEGKW